MKVLRRRNDVLITDLIQCIKNMKIFSIGGVVIPAADPAAGVPMSWDVSRWIPCGDDDSPYSLLDSYSIIFDI